MRRSVRRDLFFLWLWDGLWHTRIREEGYEYRFFLKGRRGEEGGGLAFYGKSWPPRLGNIFSE